MDVNQYGKTALLMGATGLIGTELLQLLVANVNYATIHVAGRTKPHTESPKVVFHPTELADIQNMELPPMDDVFCTLGTTLKKAGSQEAFRAVDFDAVVDLAVLAKKLNATHFAVVSSIGADANSGNFYLRTKGQMEQRVKQTGIESVIILRPSLLLGKRRQVRLGEKVGEYLSWLFTPLMVGKLRKYRPIKAAKVANAMVALCESKFGDIFIEESDDLQRF